MHNGNLSNYYELREEMLGQSSGRPLSTNDLELIQILFSQALAKDKGTQESSHQTSSDHPNFETLFRAAQHVFSRCQGGYALLIAAGEKGLLGMRDPHGIRPLVLGVRKNQGGILSHCLASETRALRVNGYEYVRNLEPGECIYIHQGQIQSRIFGENTKTRKSPRHCMFEWIYFSAPDSIDHRGKSIYHWRERLGEALGKDIRSRMQVDSEFDPELVSSVPDTSRVAALALARFMNLPFHDVLARNNYVHRSFILPSQETREEAVGMKLVPIEDQVKGKSILLVDDSIVRGTTSKKMIRLLFQAGARKVFMASTCPPIYHPCYYGVDFHSYEELVAHQRDEPLIAQAIGASGVVYLKIEALQEALQETNLCMGCLNGDYPTPVIDPELIAKNRKKHQANTLVLNR